MFIFWIFLRWILPVFFNYSYHKQHLLSYTKKNNHLLGHYTQLKTFWANISKEILNLLFPEISCFKLETLSTYSEKTSEIYLEKWLSLLHNATEVLSGARSDATSKLFLLIRKYGLASTWNLLKKRFFLEWLLELKLKFGYKYQNLEYLL